MPDKVVVPSACLVAGMCAASPVLFFSRPLAFGSVAGFVTVLVWLWIRAETKLERLMMERDRKGSK